MSKLVAQVVQGSALAEIVSKLAVITPEKYIEPNMGAGPGFCAIAEANDEVKRLYTFASMIREEHNALGKQLAAFEAKIKKATRGNLFDSLRVLAHGEIPEHEIKKLEELCGSLQKQRSLHNTVSELLWLEVRRQHLDLAKSPMVGIRRNWLLGIIDEIGVRNEALLTLQEELRERLPGFLKTST